MAPSQCIHTEKQHDNFFLNCFLKWMIFVNNKQQNRDAKPHLSHQLSSLCYHFLLFAEATVLDEADLEAVEGFISRMSSRKC